MRTRLALALCLALTACGGDDQPAADGPAADARGADGPGADAPAADARAADAPAADAAVVDGPSTDGGVTACGDMGLSCDRATQMCVRRAGGIGFTYACAAVPAGCDANRTCACAAATLCTAPFDVCADDGDNTISCECPVCA